MSNLELRRVLKALEMGKMYAEDQAWSAEGKADVKEFTEVIVYVKKQLKKLNLTHKKPTT